MGHVLKPQSPLEHLIYTSVRIEARGVSGDHWYGTGFFYQEIVEDGLNAPFLITNRHVLENAVEICIVVHREEDGHPSGSYNRTTVAIEDEAVLFHPDKNIDLAALPIAHLLEHCKSHGAPIFYKALTHSIIPTEEQWREFDFVEDVLMIGCPNGLFDEENQFAIVRKGVTASSLAVPYGGRDEFLADIACFGGSSGSPIFSYSPSVHFDRVSGGYQLGGRGMRFVGVLYAGPLYKHEGAIVMRTPVVNISTPMHLGFAIKSSVVAQMIENFLISRGSKPTRLSE